MKPIRPRPEPSPDWELFIDPSYHHMWCVRNITDKRFDSPTSFHFAEQKDAEDFYRLIQVAKR